MITINKFHIRNRKGLEIVGIISVPENPKGLVFVLHGLGGFKEQDHIKSIADVFSNNQYTVVNFDATNSIGESGGRYEDATTQTYYDDLVDVIAWAKMEDWYKEPFMIAGHSLGGYAVARYAEEYPKEVKAVFLWALVVAGELSYQKNEKLKPDEFKRWKETGWKEEESKSKSGVIKRLPWSHMEERLTHDLRPKAINLTMPVLLVVGEKDESCPPDHQRLFYDLLPGPKEFHVISGAPHTFREQKHLSEFKNILNNWIQKLK